MTVRLGTYVETLDNAAGLASLAVEIRLRRMFIEMPLGVTGSVRLFDRNSDAIQLASGAIYKFDFDPELTSGHKLYITTTALAGTNVIIVQREGWDYEKVAGSDITVGGVVLDLTPTNGLVVASGFSSTLFDAIPNTAVRPEDQNGNVLSANAVFPYLSNGISWDRPRNNEPLTLLANELATVADRPSPDQTNFNALGATIHVKTANLTGATAVYTPRVEFKAPDGTYITIWTAAAGITAVGEFTYALYPDAVAASFTEAVSLRLPRGWRFVLAAATADGGNNLDTLADMSYQL